MIIVAIRIKVPSEKRMEFLKDHMKSKCFKVFRGAMNLLREPYEMMFHTVFHPEGMEEI